MACTMPSSPTSSADFVRAYTWNGTATSVICRPISEISWPMNSLRNGRELAKRPGVDRHGADHAAGDRAASIRGPIEQRIVRCRFRCVRRLFGCQLVGHDRPRWRQRERGRGRPARRHLRRCSCQTRRARRRRASGARSPERTGPHRAPTCTALRDRRWRRRRAAAPCRPCGRSAAGRGTASTRRRGRPRPCRRRSEGRSHSCAVLRRRTSQASWAPSCPRTQSRCWPRASGVYVPSLLRPT